MADLWERMKSWFQGQFWRCSRKRPVARRGHREKNGPEGIPDIGTTNEW